MDYKQLILAALEKDDWAEIMNIASKARGEKNIDLILDDL
jgi:hypothetical protein